MAPSHTKNNRGHTIIEAAFSILIFKLIVTGFIYFILIVASQQVTLLCLEKSLVHILEGRSLHAEKSKLKREIKLWAPWIQIKYFNLTERIDRNSRMSVEGKLIWCLRYICHHTENTAKRKLGEKRISDLRL